MTYIYRNYICIIYKSLTCQFYLEYLLWIICLFFVWVFMLLMTVVYECHHFKSLILKYFILIFLMNPGS